VSNVAQPSDGPPELPSDYRAYLRPFRWPLMYGPWALGLIGLAMVGVGLFGDRPTQIALAAIGFGAAMVIAGVLLPRMQGPLELGPSGVKGAVHGLPTALMVAAVTARGVAEEMIPANEPDRDRKVDEAVGRAASHWILAEGFGERVGRPTSADLGRWAVEALEREFDSGRMWTEAERLRWWRAKLQEEVLRRKPPADQDN
jgi:hypothetical protein